MRTRWRAAGGVVCAAAICQASSGGMLKFRSATDRTDVGAGRTAARYRYGIGGNGASPNNPQPVHLALLGTGLLGIGTIFRRRMSKS